MPKFSYSQILLIILLNISYTTSSQINAPVQTSNQIKLAAGSPVTLGKVTNDTTKNIYFSDMNAFGTFGGICTCPDGSEYHVADRRNSCGDLACIGGVAGRCFGNTENNWRHMGVICDGKTPKPSPLTTKTAAKPKTTTATTKDTGKRLMGLAQETSKSDSSTTTETTTTTTSTASTSTAVVNINKDVTISWDKRTLCQFDTSLSLDNKVHCRTMLACMNTQEHQDTFSCVDWDPKAEVLNKFELTGCNQDLGINTCSEGLVTASCEKKHGVFDSENFLTNRLYACHLDTNPDYIIEYGDCKFDNTAKIAKCCENNTGNGMTCRHFKLEGDGNANVVEEMVAANPNYRLGSLADTITFSNP